jgi:hypothetical protein
MIKGILDINPQVIILGKTVIKKEVNIPKLLLFYIGHFHLKATIFSSLKVFNF